MFKWQKKPKSWQRSGSYFSNVLSRVIFFKLTIRKLSNSNIHLCFFLLCDFSSICLLSRYNEYRKKLLLVSHFESWFLLVFRALNCLKSSIFRKIFKHGEKIYTILFNHQKTERVIDFFWTKFWDNTNK